jgi:hypothetical protein
MVRLAGAAAACVLLVGCTSRHTQAPTKPATASTRPISTSVTTASQPAAAATLPCRNYIDTHPPPAGFQIVLGVVALPTSPSYSALQTSLTGAGNGPLRLFAKTGLVIKNRESFELIVPTEVADHLSIGWGGGPSTPSHRVVVSNCASAGGSGWLAYPGGYWIDHPACVPLIVKAGTRQQEVHIGLGTPCPGQAPPQGPSDR